MGYVYALMWILVGILLFIKTKKVNPLFLIISLYFEFMGIWWFINEMFDADMFTGTYLLVFRAVSLGVLILAMTMYFKEKRKINSK